jgi:hypothetical protein
MGIPTNDADWMTYLSQILEAERPALKVLNNEYELQSTRSYMHPDILREVEPRLQQVVIAWPELVVSSIEERLDVEGFRLPDEDAADDDLWRVWQANNLDEESQLAHVDALVMKRSYLTVGTNEDDADTPLVTVESPLEVYADIDPRTRKVRAAVRLWQENVNSSVRQVERYRTLYLPNRTIHEDMGPQGWRVIDLDEHNLGEVPVVPLTNRARLADRYGRSELTRILPLAHAANKLATDMMVAAEFVALPLRGLWGVGPDDIEDADGNRLTALQAIMGRLLTLPVEGGKEFEFAGADLSKFFQAIEALGKLVASIAGLPPHYLGQATDNPASADAIRSAAARLIKRSERVQRSFGGSDERTMRLVRRFQTGEWDPRMLRLETIWRDASTPTIAQKADAAVKLHAERIVPTRQTREDLGYTQAQIARMEEEDAKAQAADPVTQMSRALAQQPTPAEPGATGGGA